MAEDEKDVPERSLMIFGRDVSKVPCYRSTILNGTFGGIGCGLTYFLFTSRVKASTDVAVASFALIALGYWIHCRYNYGKLKYEMMRLQEGVALGNVLEGSEIERKLKQGEKVDI